MFTGLIQHLHKVKFLVNDNTPTILTGMGVSGTVVTAYLTGRASFKAAHLIEETETQLAVQETADDNGSVIEDLELTLPAKVKLVWQLYIPPFIAGATTITCIIVANRIASKKIVALTVASGISERALQEYKDKVIEKLGERENTKIHDQIAQDRINNHPLKEVILAGTGEVLCYDMLTGRYFQSTIEEIKRAENKINHELIHFMRASLSEFYDEIGLPATPYTDTVGWSTEPVEVRISTVLSSDNRPCVAIDFVNPPTSEYDRNVYR